MSDFTEIISIVMNGALDLMKSHGVIVGALALIGLISIISAVFSKVFEAIRILFTFFIALPLIGLIGIFRFKDKQTRKKELGEIRAFVKDNPDKFKKLIYGILVIIFFLIIAIVIIYFISMFFRPLLQFNEISKDLIKNYTLNQTNITR